MIFETTMTPDGERLCSIDGYPVPEDVYDGLLPSKLFPSDAALPQEEALAALEEIKASAPAPEPHKGPYFVLAIDGAHPLKSTASPMQSASRAPADRILATVFLPLCGDGVAMTRKAG